MNKCGCGCGQELKINAKGIMPHFINGHNRRNAIFSVEHHKKLKLARIGYAPNEGKIFSKEHCENLRLAHIGIRRSEESIKKQKENAKNNPNYGMKNKHHSKEFVIKNKQRVKQNWIDGKFKNVNLNKHYKQGNFYSEKNNKNLHYRSSWELKTYQIFEQISKIISYEIEPFGIEYNDSNNEKHNYFPDILITYDDYSQELIEIKPKRYLKEPKNILKIEAAKKYVQKNNMKFNIITEDNLFKKVGS